jgi:hypothetical protein
LLIFFISSISVTSTTSFSLAIENIYTIKTEKKESKIKPSILVNHEYREFPSIKKSLARNHKTSAARILKGISLRIVLFFVTNG